MKEKKTISAVVVAAGGGTRFGRDKLFLLLKGQTVLERSVSLFLRPEVTEVIVVCNSKTITKCKKLLKNKFPHEQRLKFILGGKERWESSLAGIKTALGEVVAIHDAARPLTEEKLVTEVLKQGAKHGAALLAMPATDSVKLVNDSGDNLRSLARAEIFLAQTPQVFGRELILQAYNLALKKKYQQMTDESELITRFLKKKVKVVTSTGRNLKITFPLDLALARVLIKTPLVHTIKTSP
jgi:2-C-methyl-D-erythritol 4-phosphate cytidylyltransferase